MSRKMSAARRRALVQMESLIGGACYNANIQNYGPGGLREAEARAFRYPLTMRLPGGRTVKVRDAAVPDSIPSEAILSGCYAFGANQLDVMAGLERILEFLEQRYGLVIPD